VTKIVTADDRKGRKLSAQVSYDLRPCTIADVAALCKAHHGYGGAGGQATAAYAVYEQGRIVAAYAWQPPPPGAAKSVCPSTPAGVLALSRMVALPREDRELNHVSKPLRRQMVRLLDRGRWPALVTYSDEGQGHTGHVYKCSGWRATGRSRRPWYYTLDGTRVSSYSNGRSTRSGRFFGGYTWIQRWEHWVCAENEAADWMRAHGWARVKIDGKVWWSGNQAYRWERLFDFGINRSTGIGTRSHGIVTALHPGDVARLG